MSESEPPNDPVDAGSAPIEMVIPLRWRDLDPYGHVNNAVYLTYLEQAHAEAIWRTLRDLPEQAQFVLARLAIDYRRELRLEDGPITVACLFTTLGRSSLGLRETIRTATGALAAEAEAVIVKFDEETRRSRNWSEEERRALLAAGARPKA